MMAVVWLGLMVLFLLLEAGTVALVSLWFAAGALAAILVSLLGGNLVIQSLVFLVVSCALLALARPVLRKYYTPRITRTNVDSLPGSLGLVTADIDNVVGAGEVKLGAMTWTARSTDGSPIPAGTQVRVDRIEGVKAFVSPLRVGAGMEYGKKSQEVKKYVDFGNCYCSGAVHSDRGHFRGAAVPGVCHRAPGRVP